MRLLTFRLRGVEAPRIGARVSRQVLDLAAAAGVAGDAPPPSRMRDLLAAGSHGRFAGSNQKADGLLLHLIGNQRSISVLVVEIPVAVGLLE